MKTKKSYLVMIAASLLLTASSCDNDDNYVPEAPVVSAFNSKYPEAEQVGWENKKGYKVADFTLNAKEAEAWFDTNGNWMMTETDILFNELPTPIQTEFAISAYGSWQVEDVDMLTRPDAATVYVIEVEQGERDIDLYYAEDGTLLKEVTEGAQDGYEPSAAPSAALEKLAALYPMATILEYDREGVYLEIDIRHENIHKEVLFDAANNWVSTEWDVRVEDVPVVVMNAVKASEYGSYQIDDVDLRETPEGVFFVFEMESGENETYLTIKADGTVV